MELDDWITTADAVELSGYHPDHLRELLRAGKIQGRKFGRLVWQINRESLNAYIVSMRERGEKPGPKTDVDNDQ